MVADDVAIDRGGVPGIHALRRRLGLDWWPSPLRRRLRKRNGTRGLGDRPRDADAAIGVADQVADMSLRRRVADGDDDPVVGPAPAKSYRAHAIDRFQCRGAFLPHLLGPRPRL